uniref:NADH dehydrogenase subunit 5 n=1 Tax=Halticus minutus TaxID=2917254 RepID=UPI001F133776|nr:NADH dehydrogenase subunit 5 [Halticus minutus]UKT60748.1 NADH dehydrogenase subunit 5 [Halticus minutus]
MFLMYYLYFFFLLILGIFLMLLGFLFLNWDISYFLDWEFLSLGSLSIKYSVIFDYMSLMFMGCVMMISSMVVFYSESYMINDKNRSRFLSLIMLFVLSMMFMIMSPNMVSILLGWDGLGLVSYCLVIYYQNSKSYNAGMLTILTNRIGDVIILVSIAWMMNFGGWNFIFYLYIYNDSMNYLYIFMALAGFTKSAQIPFSSWLPAAMAAPTPVSSLVHSSTLVTAGVYLLIRFSHMFSFYNMNMFLYLSLMTLLMSGVGASFEFDLKKIIAMSTLSQLSLMMSILFMGFPNLAFFHLLSHAFFKALLFLCAGLIIHCMNDSQDIRDMGYVGNMLPYTGSMFIVSSMSLLGMPFLSGFYSKDMILESMFMVNSNLFIYTMMISSVFFTFIYTFRLMYYFMYSGSCNFVFLCYEEDKVMNLSMILLYMMSLFMGFFMSFTMFKTPIFFLSSMMVKLMPMILLFMGFMLGYFFMNFNFYIGFMYFVLGSMWFLPVAGVLLYSNSLALSCKYKNMMDLSWGEFMFSRLSWFYMCNMGKLYNLLEGKSIKYYLFSFLFFILYFYL